MKRLKLALLSLVTTGIARLSWGEALTMSSVELASPERGVIPYVEGTYSSTWEQRGLRVNLEFNVGENVEEIARRFAGERDWRPIARYLAQLARRESARSNAKVVIPLEQILHRFVRSKAFTFGPQNLPSSSAPNCLNCALNVNRTTGHRLAQTTPSEFWKEMAEKYRYVQRGQALRTGDVLAYANTRGELVHAMTYLGKSGDTDIVFTKNGVRASHPYLFASRKEVERIYFPDQDYRLMVLRSISDNERPVGLDAVTDPARRVTYEVGRSLCTSTAKSSLWPLSY